MQHTDAAFTRRKGLAALTAARQAGFWERHVMGISAWPRPDHSSLMFAALIMGHHFSISAF